MKKHLLVVVALVCATMCCLFAFACGNVEIDLIELSRDELTLEVGESEKITANVFPLNASDKSVTWSVSPSDIATVDESGTVTAKKAGTGKVTATAKTGGKSASLDLTVKASVKSVTLDKEDVELKVGETVTLNATVTPDYATDKTVTWSVSKVDGIDEGVAEVDANGKVTAKKAGSAVIVAKAGNESASCLVTVIDVKTVTATEWSAALMAATGNYTATANSTDGSVKRTMKVAGEKYSESTEMTMGAVSVKTETIYSVESGAYYKYEKAGESDWEKTAITEEDYTGNSQGRMLVAAFVGSYSSFEYDDLLEVYKADSITLSVDSTTLEFVNVKIRFANGALKSMEAVTQEGAVMETKISDVGTTEITLPTVEPVRYEVTAEEWLTVLGTPYNNMSVSQSLDGSLNMTLQFDGDKICVSAPVPSGETTMSTVYTKESDGAYYVYQSADGNTYTKNPSDEGTFLGFQSIINSINYFAEKFADFSFNNGSNAYTAASVTVGSGEDGTTTFENVKILFKNGALEHMEFGMTAVIDEEQTQTLTYDISFIGKTLVVVPTVTGETA